MKCWKKITALVITLVLLLTVVPLLTANSPTSNMSIVNAITIPSNSAYCYIIGQKSGQINGSVTLKGKENSINVLDYGTEIIRAFDTTGLPTGSAKYDTFMIVKEFDKASPILLNVVNSNENLTSVVLRLWRQSTQTTVVATQEQYYTITLSNARIVGRKIYTDNNGRTLEQLLFTYDKMQETYTDGGITVQVNGSF